jgi:hypothetical protein
LLALLNRLPAGTHGGHRVHGDGSQVAVDAKKPLKIRHLSAERNAGPKSISDLVALKNVWMGTEQGNESILLTEVLGEELANVTSVEGREPIEFQAGHCPIPEFDLGHR